MVCSLQEKYPDLIRPWIVEQDAKDPEEAETYIPCSFTEPLYYLAKPHAEIIEDYRAEFETHIAEDWRLNTNVVEILLGPKALEVICPAEWKGIHGFEPLELVWKDEMPAVYKPTVRPINPRLYEDAAKTRSSNQQQL